jgi:hypothetical protein
MPRAEFEPAIPMIERPKTVLALDRAAIETGKLMLRFKIKSYSFSHHVNNLPMTFNIFLWNPKFHYHVCKNPPLVSVLKQVDPVHILPSSFHNNYSNITFPSVPRSSKWYSFQWICPMQTPNIPCFESLIRFPLPVSFQNIHSLEDHPCCLSATAYSVYS